jgi:hypothetical protein
LGLKQILFPYLITLRADYRDLLRLEDAFQLEKVKIIPSLLGKKMIFI